MTDDHAKRLQALFAKQGVASVIDEYQILVIQTLPLRIWINRRPWYCDRGRWQVNAESTDSIRLSIDGADMFPRYYFGDDALVSEVIAWMTMRLDNMSPR